MKRNILFLFWLIGLIVLEYGCNCGADHYFEIKNINSRIRLQNGQELTFRPVKYDSIIFFFDIESSEICEQLKPSRSSSLLACDDTDEWYENYIQRSSVEIDRVYIDKIKDGITLFTSQVYPYPNFDEHQNTDSIYLKSVELDTTFGFQNLNRSSSIALVYPPTKTDTFQFTFRFFDTQGNIFETTADPIIITP